MKKLLWGLALLFFIGILVSAIYEPDHGMIHWLFLRHAEQRMTKLFSGHEADIQREIACDREKFRLTSTQELELTDSNINNAECSGKESTFAGLKKHYRFSVYQGDSHAPIEITIAGFRHGPFQKHWIMIDLIVNEKDERAMSRLTAPEISPKRWPDQFSNYCWVFGHTYVGCTGKGR